MTVSVNRSRVQYTANGSTTAFNVTFPAITQGEIVVTVTTAGTDSVKTLNTHYTLTAAPFSTGTVTFLTSPSDYTPANNTTITISRNLDFLQSTDYQANDALDATTLETAFDKATLLAQQLDDDKSRMLKFSGTLTDSFDSDDTITTITSSSSDRANKALKFDANGDIGISTNDPDAQVASATAQATAAALSASGAASSASTASGHATTASNYALKVDGAVTGSDYSSKAWAIGGTGVTDTASRGAAKEWATAAEDDLVDTSEYSAKHYSAKASASASAASSSASAAAASAIAMAIALGIILTPFF